MTITLYRSDFHLHTCLSPCGDLSMSPRAIVREAIRKNLNIIAVSDHNTAGNVRAVQMAALGTDLVVLPGMEIASREEVHILAIFPDVETAELIQEQIYDVLDESGDENYIQDQVLANGDDEVEGFCSKILLSATPFSVRKVVEMIHGVKGLAIAAHIDRQAFGIIGQLGFIPPRVTFDALEISWRLPLEEGIKRYPQYAGYTFVTNSDAHYIEDIGKVCTHYYLNEPTFEEIANALGKSHCCHVGSAG